MIKNIVLLYVMLWFASGCTTMEVSEQRMEILMESFCMEHKCTSNKKHETMDIDELSEVLNAI